MGLPNQTSKIARRSRNVPLEHGRWSGSIMDSLTTRITEVGAIQRLRFGDPIPATDAIGDAKRAGKIRCARCNQYQEPRCFAAWTNPVTGKTYQKTLCNSCRHKLDKAKHMRDLELPSPYPARIG